jgi:hypothetical protein
MKKNLVVVAGSQPPALPPEPPPIKWKDFKRFMHVLNELNEYFDELKSCRFGPADSSSMAIGDLEDNAEWCQERLAKARAGFERFDHPDNYEPGNDDDDGEGSELKRSHIGKRIGVLIASFPAANPGTPEGYQQMLVEHISAVEGLTAVALESTCREVVETQKFAPTISEMMRILEKHVGEWRRRRWVLRDVERMRLETIKTLIEREQKTKKEEREEQIRRASSAATGAMYATQKLAKEIEGKRAELTTLLQRHAIAEQRETALMQALRKLTASEEEQEAEAAAKANGAGCGHLPLLH